MSNKHPSASFRPGFDPRRNIGGKPRGTRNKLTIEMEQAADCLKQVIVANMPDVAQIIAARALEGDSFILKMIMDRMWPVTAALINQQTVVQAPHPPDITVYVGNPPDGIDSNAAPPDDPDDPDDPEWPAEAEQADEEPYQEELEPEPEPPRHQPPRLPGPWSRL